MLVVTRFSLLVLALQVLIALPDTAGADQRGDFCVSHTRPVEVDRDRSNAAVRYDAEGGAVCTAAPSPAGPGSPGGARRATAVPPQFVLWLPNLVNRGPDDWCVVGERHLYPTAEVLAEARRATAGVWATALGDFELCAGSERPEPVPAVEAALWWREAGEDLLPRPDPWIAPGFGITGMRSFLEARSPVTARFEHDTALGHLVVEATSTLYVDWGDTGWIDGPYRGPGAPRPDGTIHHSWTDMGAYDVRVEQRWSATWRLGEQSGTLAGLVTEGRIDDFPVDQIQAVRNR